MKCLFILAFITLMVSSCVNTKKYESILIEKVKSNIDTFHTDYNQNSVFINCNKLVHLPQLATVKKIRAHDILSLGWKRRFLCVLTTDLAAGSMMEYFYFNNECSSLYQMLKNRRLEISVEKIPHRFMYQSDVSYAIMGTIATSQVTDVIIPQKHNIELTFQVIEGDSIVKEGFVEVIDYPLHYSNLWVSDQRKFEAYIDEYMFTLFKMNRLILHKLLLALEDVN